MKVKETGFKDLWVIQPNIFEDKRGYFFESFNENTFQKLTQLNVSFVQDNESKSQKGVVRGLHFQAPPHAQGKLVRVIKGSVLDVVVDIRKHSQTYGHSYAVELSETNKTQFYIPPGFAHGFSTLENDTIFAYKCTAFYNKESEGCIKWNDPDLNINWKINQPIVSEKDQKGVLFQDFLTPFDI